MAYAVDVLVQEGSPKRWNYLDPWRFGHIITIARKRAHDEIDADRLIVMFSVHLQGFRLRFRLGVQSAKSSKHKFLRVGVENNRLSFLI